MQQSREINQEACHLPGFTVLQWLLPKHASVPEIYFLLFALSQGHTVHESLEDCQVGWFTFSFCPKCLLIITFKCLFKWSLLAEMYMRV